MFMLEVELFRNLGSDFMEEVANAAEEKSFRLDQILFRRGEPAENLYLLEEGRVNLFIENGGSLNFILDKSGEVFGWSALVEPNVYTTSAQCSEKTKALRIDRARLEHIFEKYPQEAYLIMKRLAGVIGQRLARAYDDVLQSREAKTAPSYG